MERAIGALGLPIIIGIAWLFSSHRKKFPWRVVVGGLGLQFAIAALILRTQTGRTVFQFIGDMFTSLLDFVSKGSEFVFGEQYTNFYFAFKVLPTIIFFSALMGILYHLGVMQFIVRILGRMMQFTLGTSGAESLSAAANIFVGQTEAPFVVLPYIRKMTQSELMAVMVGGFATVAGGVLAVYISMGINAGHLVTASFISAPAALLIAKVLQPEVGTPLTRGSGDAMADPGTTNIIEAATHGASEGLKLALNVAAMLIAFLALIALCDFLMEWTSLFIMEDMLGWENPRAWTLSRIMGYVFWPLAWIMGIPSSECQSAGELLGLKMIANELVSYQQMSGWIAESTTTPVVDQTLCSISAGTTGFCPFPPLILSAAPPEAVLSRRTIVIMTYALSGFSSFASIGIQVGGIGGLCPERRADLAHLGLRAMFGGMLACCMTACVAGLLLE